MVASRVERAKRAFIVVLKELAGRRACAAKVKKSALPLLKFDTVRGDVAVVRERSAGGVRGHSQREPPLPP